MDCRQKTGWAPEVVWTVWSVENSLTPAGIQVPVVQPVAGLYAD
jgi:hypothetical protein